MANINVNQALASETAKGIVEEATQAQANAGTDTGETGAKLFVPPSKLPTVVRITPLTGFSVGANSTILATDTVAGAFAKTQGQINARPNETASTIGVIVNNAAPATPNDTDLVATAESSVIKNITWTNVKAFLKTYFDTLYATASNTLTFTNKRITARTSTEASSATPTINTDNVDYHSVTALATAITSFTTNLSGTPTDAQTLWISITDDGTARAIAWGASFESSGNITLPTTTVISTRLDVGFIWNAATSRWRCVGKA